MCWGQTSEGPEIGQWPSSPLVHVVPMLVKLSTSNKDEQSYDSEEDGDWWNEFCVPEIEPLQEIGKDRAEDFKDLLNWIDNEFDLEVAQNCKKSAILIP